MTDEDDEGVAVFPLSSRFDNDLDNINSGTLDVRKVTLFVFRWTMVFGMGCLLGLMFMSYQDSFSVATQEGHFPSNQVPPLTSSVQLPQPQSVDSEEEQEEPDEDECEPTTECDTSISEWVCSERCCLWDTETSKCSMAVSDEELEKLRANLKAFHEMVRARAEFASMITVEPTKTSHTETAPIAKLPATSPCQPEVASCATSLSLHVCHERCCLWEGSEPIRTDTSYCTIPQTPEEIARHKKVLEAFLAEREDENKRNSHNHPAKKQPAPKPAAPEPHPQPVVKPGECLVRLCDEALTPEDCGSFCKCEWVSNWKKQPDGDLLGICRYRDGHTIIGPLAEPRPVPPVWDGTYDKLPRPLPKGFGGEPLAHARGKYAYVTAVSPFVFFRMGTERWVMCNALALVTSIKRTNPASNIDIVIAVIMHDDDQRFYGQAPLTLADMPKILGENFHDALVQAGVTKFVIWHELDTDGLIVGGGNWKYAYSKVQVWKLTDYEKVLFLDSDTLVLKNMDHLFTEHDEFAAAGTWGCHNPNSALLPSGGFWLLRPSLKTWNVIERYLTGPDPCGSKWFMGDMQVVRLLFMDHEAFVGLNNSRAAVHEYRVARWDGDIKGYLGAERTDRMGRCETFVTYHDSPTHRLDAIVPARGVPGYISPRNRWTMLNESFDILVGPCDDNEFAGTQHDRYKKRSGGDKTWARTDAFSVHLSCFNPSVTDKPGCFPSQETVDKKLPGCIQAIFDRYYEFLEPYDMKKIASEDEVAAAKQLSAEMAGKKRLDEAKRRG